MKYIMQYLFIVRDFILNLYNKLPAGIRRFNKKHIDKIAFFMILIVAVFCYVLLFTLPTWILSFSFEAIKWLTIIFTVLIGFGLSLFVRNRRVKAVCITMTVCALMLCWYNFLTVSDRMGEIDIASVSDFKKMNRFSDGNFVLVDDVDFKDSDIVEVRNFSGKFDGCGYSISNINLDRESLFVNNNGTITGINFKNIKIKSKNSDTGLFTNNNGEISDISVNKISISATGADNVGLISKSSKAVKDITVVDADYKTTNCKNVGVICGTTSGVTNSNASGKIVASCDKNSNVGGIVGLVTGKKSDFSLVTTKVSVDVTSNKAINLGSIIGQAETAVSFEQCFSVGNIALKHLGKNDTYVGGICGKAESVKLTECIASADYSLSADNEFYFGGYVGSCDTFDNIAVSNGYVSGKAEIALGDAFVGGFVGRTGKVNAEENKGYIKNSFNTLAVKSDEGANVVSNAAFGKIDAEAFDFVTNSYFDKTSKYTAEQGVAPYAASDLYTKTFCISNLDWKNSNWDFDNIKPTLKDVINLYDSEIVDMGDISDSIYECKTISVYPTEIYDSAKQKQISCDDSVNIRKGPGTNYKKITAYHNGKAVLVVADQNGWSLIQLDDGNYGWIINNYLK